MRPGKHLATIAGMARMNFKTTPKAEPPISAVREKAANAMRRFMGSSGRCGILRATALADKRQAVVISADG